MSASLANSIGRGAQSCVLFVAVYSFGVCGLLGAPWLLRFSSYLLMAALFYLLAADTEDNEKKMCVEPSCKLLHLYLTLTS
jgi:hypothetical protein